MKYHPTQTILSLGEASSEQDPRSAQKVHDWGVGA